MCVKGRVDPSSHVVPIILRILSVLETGSMPKVLANKWSKFHSLSIAVNELLKIQYIINHPTQPPFNVIFLEIVWGEESGPSSFRRYCTNDDEKSFENNETWDIYLGLKGELTLSKLFSSFVDYMIKIPFFFHIFWIKWWRKKKRLRQRRLENSMQFLPWR